MRQVCIKCLVNDKIRNKKKMKRDRKTKRKKPRKVFQLNCTKNWRLKKQLENVTHLRLFRFRHSSAGTCQQQRVQLEIRRALGLRQPRPDDRTSRPAHCSPRSRRDRPQAAARQRRRSWDGSARQCPWVPLVAVTTVWWLQTPIRMLYIYKLVVAAQLI